MALVSVPNQMPNTCVEALAVYSATSVGIVDADPGVADFHCPAELWSVSTLMWPVPNRLSAIDCRLPSPPGAGLITDGVGEFGWSGSAATPKLALSPSSATIDFTFIYNSSRDRSLRGRVQRLAELYGRGSRRTIPWPWGSTDRPSGTGNCA